MSFDDPDQLELSFLRARIGAKLGLADEAITDYATCYTLPSSDAGLAADAIRESAALLVTLPDRKGELRALAHLYATTVGRGKLWKDAPAEVAALLDEELHKPIKAAESKVEEKDGKNPDGSSAVGAGEFVTITQFRFEPRPADTPPPVPDPTKKPVKFEPSDGTFKSVETPPGWESAETRVAVFSTGRKSHSTLTRELPEDARLKLAEGKTLRLKMDLRLSAVYKNGSKTLENSSYVRVGLLNAEKAGYGFNISLMTKDKGLAILGDPGGDDDLLGGNGIKKVPADGSTEFGSVEANKPLPCEITFQLQDQTKMLVTARVGKITGSVTMDAAADQPIVTDFTKSLFVLRFGRARSALHFDNLVVEVTP